LAENKGSRRCKMHLEAERLCIRSLKTEDEAPFVVMASDGSLRDVGFNRNCGGWMRKWIEGAKKLADSDNPTADYLAYTIVLKNRNLVIGSVGCSYYKDLQQTGITYFIGAQYRSRGYAVEAVIAYVAYFFAHYGIPALIATVREENISSWKVVERAGFQLVDKRMYQDINDDREKLYRFYEVRA